MLVRTCRWSLDGRSGGLAGWEVGAGYVSGDGVFFHERFFCEVELERVVGGEGDV